MLRVTSGDFTLKGEVIPDFGGVQESRGGPDVLRRC